MKNVSFYKQLETMIAVIILYSAKEAVVCWFVGSSFNNQFFCLRKEECSAVSFP